jgi:hypothetical protein
MKSLHQRHHIFAFYLFQRKWVEKGKIESKTNKKTECKDKLINDKVTWNANTQITNKGRTPNNTMNVKLKAK